SLAPVAALTDASCGSRVAPMTCSSCVAKTSFQASSRSSWPALQASMASTSWSSTARPIHSTRWKSVWKLTQRTNKGWSRRFAIESATPSDSPSPQRCCDRVFFPAAKARPNEWWTTAKQWERRNRRAVSAKDSTQRATTLACHYRRRHLACRRLELGPPAHPAPAAAKRRASAATTRIGSARPRSSVRYISKRLSLLTRWRGPETGMGVKIGFSWGPASNWRGGSCDDARQEGRGRLVASGLPQGGGGGRSHTRLPRGHHLLRHVWFDRHGHHPQAAQGRLHPAAPVDQLRQAGRRRVQTPSCRMGCRQWGDSGDRDGHRRPAAAQDRCRGGGRRRTR